MFLVNLNRKYGSGYRRFNVGYKVYIDESMNLYIDDDGHRYYDEDNYNRLYRVGDIYIY